MISKDRYSKSIIIFIIGLSIAMQFLKNDRNYISAAIAAIAFIPFLWTMTRPAKIYITDEQLQKLKPEFKGEKDCGFMPEYKHEVDGVRINGERYKFVNGTDHFITGNNQVKPCGFGSSLMQIAGGGKEPKTIQDDSCWK